MVKKSCKKEKTSGKKFIASNEESITSISSKRGIKKSGKLRDIMPLNEEQEAFLDSINNAFLTICQGRAGTGKTFLALVNALKLVYTEQFDKILYVRAYIPTLSIEKDMGALPGTANEKMAPCALAVLDALGPLIGEKELEKLYKEDKIEVSNVSFLRGRNLEKTIIIFDEAQNCDFNLAHMVISRAGKGSKVIVTGSLSQIDLRARYDSFLPQLIDCLADFDNVGVVELQEIVRNSELNEILTALEDAMMNDN